MIITIAGMPGSGKTTVANALAKKFKLKFFSVGTIMRRMARERGISVTEMNKLGEKNKRFDREIDDYQIMLGKKMKNAVFDGRLSFHFIPHSIKILLRCRPEEGARRIFSQDRKIEKYKSQKDALSFIKKRAASEKNRFLKYYKVNIDDKANFDIVYDTTHRSIADNKKDIIRLVGQFAKKNARAGSRTK